MRALAAVGSRASTCTRYPITPSSLLGSRRYKSSTASSDQPQAATASLSPRWLSDVKQRIGKCITFGLQPHQTTEAGLILDKISRDWRELLCGSDGFLTGPTRRGLFRHRVVWGEQDAMGHVNNVMYNRYAESGRIEWVQTYIRHIDPEHAKQWEEIMTPKGNGLILRKITTEFKFPMRYPDHITVYHKLGTKPQAGMDAFVFDVVILSELNQRIAARCYEDCVYYDYRAGKKTALKPFMIDVLGETWRLQEEARRTYSDQAHGLLDRVRKLEMESWDQEGAVEDMGSASR